MTDECFVNCWTVKPQNTTSKVLWWPGGERTCQHQGLYCTQPTLMGTTFVLCQQQGRRTPHCTQPVLMGTTFALYQHQGRTLPCTHTASPDRYHICNISASGENTALHTASTDRYHICTMSVSRKASHCTQPALMGTKFVLCQHQGRASHCTQPVLMGTTFALSWSGRSGSYLGVGIIWSYLLIW